MSGGVGGTRGAPERASPQPLQAGAPGNVPHTASSRGAPRFELATSADDEALRRLLRAAPMGGRIRLAFTREPSYFASTRLDGDRHVTVVLRDVDGTLLAMGSRSVREVFLDGRPARLGYLTQLRWAPGRHPNRHRLAAGFARTRATRRDDELPFDLTSVASDNRPARRLLERGLPGLPAYTPLFELETVVLPVRGRRGLASAAQRSPWKAWARSAGRLSRVEPANPPDGPTEAVGEDASAMARLLERDGRARRLAPHWSEESLRELASGRLGRWRPIVLRDGGEPVGCAAVWDQRTLRQVVVHSYDPLLSRLRRWPLPLWPLARQPVLPAPGTVLPMAFLSHLYAPDGAALVRLLDAALGHARADGVRYLTLALPTGDPLLAVVRRRYGGRVYGSVLYLVHDTTTAAPLQVSKPEDVRVEAASL